MVKMTTTTKTTIASNQKMTIAGRPKKGEPIKSGLETAMAKGKGGTTRTKTTKRRRCDVCGAYGHMYKNCFLLEKSEEIEHAGIQVLPIEETVTSDNEWADGSQASTL